MNDTVFRFSPKEKALGSIVEHNRTLAKRIVGQFVNRTGRYRAYGHPDTCIRCLCEDGKRRTIRLGIDADTYFSWPGRTSIGGKTVRGYVTEGGVVHGRTDLRFVTYKPKG